MNILILAVGKLKEDYFLKAQAEYVKMLGRFAAVQVVEVADEPDFSSAKEQSAAISAEGRRLLAKCPENAFVIACDPGGKKLSSEAFSAGLRDVMLRGYSKICFMVGGSGGLSNEVKARADLLLSFSDMTMPHRLFRIVLLEQVYRAFKIMRGETYHK